MMSQDKCVIQGLWIGDQLSAMEQLSIGSFLRHGHPYHLYIYDPVKNVPDGVVLKNAEEIAPKQNLFRDPSGIVSYANFSDLFRYKLLFLKGGFWVDTDTICLRPFDFDSEYVFASQSVQVSEISGKGDIFDYSSNSFISVPPLGAGEDGTQKANIWHACGGIMKSPSGSAIMNSCFEISSARMSGERDWWDLGPPLVSEAVSRFRLENFVVPPEIFCPIDWWNWHVVMDEAAGEKILSQLNRIGSYSVHLWNYMWGISGADKNAKYSPDSLYEILKATYLDETRTAQ